MPDMAMIAGQDDHPARISGQFEQVTEWTDAADRPDHGHLFAFAQEVINGVDDDADDAFFLG